MTAAPSPVASVRLPTVEWGDADAARTALLLHGLTSAGAVWWRVADALASAGFRVVAPDLRGHGHAPRTLSYALSGFAADVLRLRAASGTAWDVVVGHSLGGATATLALAGDPSWARSAVLVDPALRFAGRPGPAQIAAMAAEAEDPDAARIAAQNPSWHEEDVHQKVLAARLISRHTVEHVLLDTDPWDLTAEIEGVAVPVSLLGADPAAPDLALHPDYAAELLAANPRLRYAHVPGAHHSIFRSHPDAVVHAALAVAPPA